MSGTGPKAGGPLYLTRLVRKPPQRSPEAPWVPSPGDDVSTQDNIEWHDVVISLRQVFDQWQASPMAHRAACAERLLASLATGSPAGIDRRIRSRLQDLIDQTGEYAAPRKLSGPTGESNSLLFEGRGVLVCMVETDNVGEQGMVTAVAALLAGNTVLMLCEP